MLKLIILQIYILTILGSNLNEPDFEIFHKHKNHREKDREHYHYKKGRHHTKSEFTKVIKVDDVGSFTFNKWSCPIPYVITSEVKYPENILTAMKHISEKTGWTFIERTNEKDYLNFIDNNGCWSYLGKQGGEQDISMDEYCDVGAGIHEIAHAIGLTHEQSREDRDNFVDINYKNIKKKYNHNFDKSNAKNYDEYDYASIMHYGRWDFSKNSKKTIKPINNICNTCYIGQRMGLSDKDIKHLNNLIDGEFCSIQNSKCSKEDIQVCGVNSRVNGLDLIFNIYKPDGIKNGKTLYRSQWKFLGEFFIIYWNGNKWIIEFEYNGSHYAYSKDKDLFTAKWYFYSYSDSSYKYDEDITISNLQCKTEPTTINRTELGLECNYKNRNKKFDTILFTWIFLLTILGISCLSLLSIIVKECVKKICYKQNVQNRQNKIQIIGETNAQNILV